MLGIYDDLYLLPLDWVGCCVVVSFKDTYLLPFLGGGLPVYDFGLLPSAKCACSWEELPKQMVTVVHDITREGLSGVKQKVTRLAVIDLNCMNLNR